MDSVSNNFLYRFKASRSARRARPGFPGPPLLSPPRSGPVPASRAESGWVVNPDVAGAVGSAALGSHHGASLEDRGPHRAIAGRSTDRPIRRKLTGPDLSPHDSSRPKPLPPTSLLARLRFGSYRHAATSRAIFPVIVDVDFFCFGARQT